MSKAIRLSNNTGHPRMGGGMMGGGMMMGGSGMGPGFGSNPGFPGQFFGMNNGISGGGWAGGSMSGFGVNASGGMSGMMGMSGWQPGFPAPNLHASAGFTLARLPTQANPRRMVLTPDAKTLVVSNHLADSLTLIDADKLKVLRHIDLGGPKPDQARLGQILFHSARQTVQQQFTCASCHPNNGSDGLAWDTSSKPTGEHLNTRALHGVRDTSPFGWKGGTQTLEERAKNTTREVHKHDLSDADAAAIAANLQTLDPTRPLPQDPNNDAAITRGKAIFFGKADCKSCHRGLAYTSETPRAVIPDHQGKLTPFDVPSLRGVARTAPYLHDGRAATLEEIFVQHNLQQRYLSAPTEVELRRQLHDLILFLKQLVDIGPRLAAAWRERNNRRTLPCGSRLNASVE